MKLRDYLRLGAVGIVAQKRRVALVTVVVGALMSVLIAGCLVIQGMEDRVLVEMTRLTDGKVVLSTDADDVVAWEYGGEVVETEMVTNTEGMFYRVDNVLGSEVLGADSGVLVPMGMAAQWLGIGMYAPGMRAEERVKIAERIRSEAIGETVETKTGVRYDVVDFLPGGAFEGILRVSDERGYNPLDLVLERVETGSGWNQGLAVGEDIEGVVTPVKLAVFADVESAERFSAECECLARSVVGEPLVLRENMQGVWRVYGVISVILMVLVVAIEASTYVRLVQQDAKTIALYHAMGGTRGQVRGVYGVYLLMLSLMAVGFAVVVGWLLAMSVSVVNARVLTQAFVLGFGMEAERIWLIGWNPMVLGMMVVVLSVPLLVLGFCGRQFSKR